MFFFFQKMTIRSKKIRAPKCLNKLFFNLSVVLTVTALHKGLEIGCFVNSCILFHSDIRYILLFFSIYFFPLILIFLIVIFIFTSYQCCCFNFTIFLFFVERWINNTASFLFESHLFHVKQFLNKIVININAVLFFVFLHSFCRIT